MNDDGVVDLAIYLSSDDPAMKRPSLYRPSFGWGDQYRRPDASITPKGALVLQFGNDMGRDRWSKKYTILSRQGQLLVAGYTYNERDALQRGKGYRCDINLLTGSGVREGKSVQFPAGGVALNIWTEGRGEALCNGAPDGN
ncbi:MAG: hypothetical protein LBV29_09155 [Azoarcus sp.]|nr:hypothetical protein [Azoarcus sp.]